MDSGTNIGQWSRSALFTTMTMEFTSREVIAQLLHVILHIFVEQAYKTIHLVLHKLFLNLTRLSKPQFLTPNCISQLWEILKSRYCYNNLGEQWNQMMGMRKLSSNVQVKIR